MEGTDCRNHSFPATALPACTRRALPLVGGDGLGDRAASGAASGAGLGFLHSLTPMARRQTVTRIGSRLGLVGTVESYTVFGRPRTGLLEPGMAAGKGRSARSKNAEG